MHEWALAESVVVTIIKETENNNIKNISKVIIKVGELQQLDLVILRFALENIIESYGLSLDMSRIIIDMDKGELKCKVCGRVWSFDESLKRLQDSETEAIHFIPEIAHIYIRCPECKSPDFEILRGRGVYIESIEGEC
jgi:hydrogenase nickel incorporation protein HypA/HybF